MKNCFFHPKRIPSSCFNEAVYNLYKRKIEIVVHLILGIPGESKEDMLSSVKFISRQTVKGVKLHLLHILKYTPLHEIYKKSL